MALVAMTAHVYVFPVVSDATVIGDDARVTNCVVPPSLEVHVAV